MEKPSTFMVRISRDWDDGKPESYDPQCVFTCKYANRQDALDGISKHLTACNLPANGYIISIFAKGPLGGNRGHHTERTLRHPDATSLITALEKNFKHR